MPQCGYLFLMYINLNNWNVSNKSWRCPWLSEGLCSDWENVCAGRVGGWNSQLVLAVCATSGCWHFIWTRQLTKKFREESNIKFKSEFRFNEEILDGLHKLHKLIPSTDKTSGCCCRSNSSSWSFSSSNGSAIGENEPCCRTFELRITYLRYYIYNETFFSL
jgi:hypothetical protein